MTAGIPTKENRVYGRIMKEWQGAEDDNKFVPYGFVSAEDSDEIRKLSKLYSGVKSSAREGLVTAMEITVPRLVKEIDHYQPSSVYGEIIINIMKKEMEGSLSGLVHEGYSNALDEMMDDARDYAAHIENESMRQGRYFNDVRRQGYQSPLDRIVNRAEEFAGIVGRDISSEVREVYTTAGLEKGKTFFN